MQETIPISGGFFHCPNRAAAIVALPESTLWRWAKARSTGYGHLLNVVEHQGHLLIDERDVHAVAAVQKDFPIGKGPIPPDRREQMKNYAAQVRAKLAPSR